MSVFDTLKKVTSLLDGHKEEQLKDSKLLEESREEQLKESLKDPKLVETLKGFLSPESKDMLSKFTAILKSRPDKAKELLEALKGMTGLKTNTELLQGLNKFQSGEFARELDANKEQLLDLSERIKKGQYVHVNAKTAKTGVAVRALMKTVASRRALYYLAAHTFYSQEKASNQKFQSNTAQARQASGRD